MNKKRSIIFTAIKRKAIHRFFTVQHVKEYFFNQTDKCCNHWSRYNTGIKMLEKSLKKHRDFGHPMNSINISTL